MPSSRIMVNFKLENGSAFVDAFHHIMMGVLKIPDYDRLVLLDQRIDGFYQPINTSGKYALFEIDMFPGRTQKTKRKLYPESVSAPQEVLLECIR